MDYTSVDRVLAKLHRELKNSELDEADVIEWVGEAMDHLKVHAITEQAVAFIEVKDYECELPMGFQMVLQIARNMNWSKVDDQCLCPSTVMEEVTVDTSVPGVTTTTTVTITDPNCAPLSTYKPKAGQPVPLDCKGTPITDYELAYYRPYFDLQYWYNGWTNSDFYHNNYVPVRLADHTFFKSVVCKEQDHDSIYSSCRDEYTIVGYGANRKLRFSFKEGSIALAFQKSVIDRETGYPMVPDDISFITAITYYVKWKIAESLDWNGREGFAGQSDKAERRWLKYARQAKNKAKMPKTLDDYQDLLEQSHYLIPNHKRFYGFFGNLNQPEGRDFNNPDRDY